MVVGGVRRLEERFDPTWPPFMRALWFERRMCRCFGLTSAYYEEIFVSRVLRWWISYYAAEEERLPDGECFFESCMEPAWCLRGTLPTRPGYTHASELPS